MPSAHWAMSRWWAPQSVILPPLYSYDPPRLLGRLHQQQCLFDGERQRLLAVDVLTLAHGVDGAEGVPVVRRGDQDGVDVLIVVQFAEVAVGAGLVAVGLERRLRLLG